MHVIGQLAYIHDQKGMQWQIVSTPATMIFLHWTLMFNFYMPFIYFIFIFFSYFYGFTFLTVCLSIIGCQDCFPKAIDRIGVPEFCDTMTVRNWKSQVQICLCCLSFTILAGQHGIAKSDHRGATIVYRKITQKMNTCIPCTVSFKLLLALCEVTAT